MTQRVLITGGAGYVGSALVPRLMAAGHRVTVYDTFWFGDFLPEESASLTKIRADIRDVARFREAVAGCDAVIHLACISNDPSFALDEALSTSINLDAFEPLVIASKAAGVRRFVYASTSSVYGVSESERVTEDHPLVPLTLYNDFKGRCEPLLFKHMADDFTCVTIRPSTVCGYAPRLRLDLTVNILTSHAVNKGQITVFGGEQERPNIHIDDMCRLYEMLLDLPDAAIQGKTWNAGWRNMKVKDIAETVKRVVEAEFPDQAPIPIETTPSDDKRSYRVDAAKIAADIGFVPEKTVEDAVRDLCAAFRAGKIPNPLGDPRYVNVKTLQDKQAA